MSPRVLRVTNGAIAAAATARFALAIASAARATRGDFYATLPGAYAETINPVLWNSPDLVDSWAYHQRTYLHGPAQYLTLYPIVFLNSYARIAAVLLIVYTALVVVLVVLLKRLCDRVARRPVPWVAVYASVVLFTPLLQALGQREFEVVTAVATVSGCLAIVTGRSAVGGSLFAYVTSFKYAPVLALPYFAARRWWRAIAGYTGTMAAIAIVAEALFGLERFFNNNVPQIAREQWSALQSTSAFCDVWLNPASHHIALANQTFAGLRWGLCNLHDRHQWIQPPLIYLLLGVAVAVAAIGSFLRLERGAVRDDVEERWRRNLELSLVIVIYTTFFYMHYYYLCILVVPLTTLLARLIDVSRPRAQVALWIAAYVVLAALVMPASVFSTLFRRDLWSFYMGHALYVYGELLLIALLLSEYRALAVRCALPIAASVSTVGIAGND